MDGGNEITEEEDIEMGGKQRNTLVLVIEK